LCRNEDREYAYGEGVRLGKDADEAD